MLVSTSVKNHVSITIQGFCEEVEVVLVMESSTVALHESETQAATRLLYSRRLSIYNCAASLFAGEEGFGSDSND